MADHDRPGRPRPIERLAAFTALAALPGALTTLIVGAVMNWAALVATVAALLVGVTAGWHAVSRRGMRRAMAGLGMVLTAVWNRRGGEGGSAGSGVLVPRAHGEHMHAGIVPDTSERGTAAVGALGRRPLARPAQRTGMMSGAPSRTASAVWSSGCC
ncbi:hypothetical protein AB0D12_18985 [Streptomyces sp. NPDC048479]|uniref:hypothetical protein n=1 Tax=Streptomyces sp. NPDC048479 TaxID=3154725 RepID=UPI003426F67E